MKHTKLLKLKILLITISLYFIQQLKAIDFNELINKIQQQDEKIQKIKAEYYQTINIIDLNETYFLKADFVFLKPDKLKVNVYEPIQQIIVADSKKICVKNINENTVYRFDTKKYFDKEYSYLPLIFSKKDKKYSISDFIKKTGLKFVTEEEKYYILSTRYAKGKVYADKKIGLRPGETRFIMWINKETMFPEKVSMLSEKYIIETEFKNYQTEFEISPTEFEIQTNENTKVIDVK